MYDYELTLVLAGDASLAKKKSVQERIEKLLKTGKGKIVKADDWGKIDLAYPIKKETAGVFIHYSLDIESETAKNIKDKLRLNSDIIRYLFVKTSKS